MNKIKLKLIMLFLMNENEQYLRNQAKELFSSKATNFELRERRRLSEEQNPIRKEFVVILFYTYCKYLFKFC